MARRSVVITGGFGVLGEAVSRAFAARGDQVARIDRSDRAGGALQGVLDIGSIDLTDFDQARSAVARVVAVHGTLDVLINVAGAFTWETLGDGEDTATWRRLFEANALTCANMTKAALPELLRAEEARVVSIGAIAALAAGAGMGAYAASKMAVHKLTESLAAELKEASVTVNAVLPSIIDTEANRIAMPDADRSDWVDPRTIAEAIVLLASPEARGITGALIPVTRR